MHPQSPCGHHPDCRARGHVGQGNIGVHRPAEPRYRGTTCGQPFAATTGTPCSRWRTAADLVTLGRTGLSHGGPTQAIVAALGLEERTVAVWWVRAGHPGQPGQRHVIPQGQGDRPQVQADERWVTRGGRRVWMALAMAVPARLWLGGVISSPRALVVSTTLVPRVRSGAHTLAILVGVAGWASSVTAWPRVCRPPVRPGHRGRPRVVEAPEVLLGPGVQRDVQRRVARVEHRVVRGSEAAIGVVRVAPHSGTGSKTSNMERRHATCRASRAPLVRRGRAIWPTAAGLTAGRWLGGWADTCCWRHQRRR